MTELAPELGNQAVRVLCTNHVYVTLRMHTLQELQRFGDPALCCVYHR